uniref:Uncharacterized protein n=1 Tax=Parascaris equorum TaxID=6256 RepID=A0A914RL67_PAREQ
MVSRSPESHWDEYVSPKWALCNSKLVLLPTTAAFFFGSGGGANFNAAATVDPALVFTPVDPTLVFK